MQPCSNKLTHSYLSPTDSVHELTDVVQGRATDLETLRARSNPELPLDNPAWEVNLETVQWEVRGCTLRRALNVSVLLLVDSTRILIFFTSLFAYDTLNFQ